MGGLSTILMFVVMIGLIFIMQRQQKKQAQARQDQLNTIEKGDEIVTIGGMFALVDEVNKEANRVVLDVDGIYLPFELGAVKRIVTKAGAQEESVVTKELVETEEAVSVVEPAEGESEVESND
ncbi:preprotein translocase subunit YajC [Streptococcus iniae]|uniref:Preprotein translocase subunit YajC n=1 Tax=Streptococcus iniae TaxID=1346 RepID=A0ABN4D5N1_STRIN|nr:preprotein translocase subunit YajC [Streptococcus iniae]AHY15170.1 preprotein translocase subunit YajC [Streptococcus iniae]AHY17041.1 preprotein translocase subunit YajC [Streptococcus iniae]RLV09188.1 preprotein translocase subunit YajC [Streptococcus iniae]RLV14980.1 preprotein translocase subunit YajC [Streptococcus iniae]RLV15732.1 preprotein translocase subunit YajC [Streptococcus iniae]